jgi:hypothetical protein
LLEILLCFVGAALPQARDSACGVSLGTLRFERDVSGEIGFGARPLFLASPQRSAIEPHAGKARIQLDGLVVIGHCAVQIAIELPRCASVAEGFGVTEPEFERPSLIADRAVLVFQPEAQNAAIVVGFGVLRIKFQGHPEPA